MSDRWPRSAVVLGAGTMGAGFAQLFGLAGIDTAVVDASPALAEQGRERALELARRFEDLELFEPGAADAIAARTRAAGAIGEAVAGADFVLEAVTEDRDVKRRAYEAVEAAAPDGVVIATNTSAIPIRQLAAGRRDPARFLGTHWFNPPQWIPCVEVIPSADTSDSAVRDVHRLLARLGKQPVTVGDAAGFVANRIQFAMFKEAASVVRDGVATADQVDEVVRASFGFRLPIFGPFMIAEMAGLDVYAGAYEALREDLGERFAAPESVAEHVEAGRLGTKTGGAYFEPPAAGLAALVERRDVAYHALARLLGELEREPVT